MFLRWAERVLLTAGAAMLVWCALLVTDASVYQWLARRSFETAPHTDPSPYSGLPDATTQVQRPAPTSPRGPIRRGSPVADLSIPRVHLSAIVLNGSDARTLRRGPGHLENTALPGESGNVVIAGHRDSFFRSLRNVQLGDDIFLEAPQGRFHYRVASLRVTNSHDVSVLEPTDAEVLTLITCYPFWVLGHAPDRFVVRATRIGDGPTVTASAQRPTGPPESITAPAVHVQPVDAKEPVVRKPARVYNDEDLIRQAIERFRVAHNARLITHGESGLDGLLRFETCHVPVGDDRAAVTCDAASQFPDGRKPTVWAFTVERATGGWAIRSVEME